MSLKLNKSALFLKKKRNFLSIQLLLQWEIVLFFKIKDYS